MTPAMTVALRDASREGGLAGGRKKSDGGDLVPGLLAAAAANGSKPNGNSDGPREVELSRSESEEARGRNTNLLRRISEGDEAKKDGDDIGRFALVVGLEVCNPELDKGFGGFPWKC